MQAQTEYTDIESVAAYLGIDAPAGSSEEAEEIAGYIRAMSATMDNMSGRRLYGDEETTNTYDGEKGEILHVKDVCAISEVLLDGADVTEAIYKYPQNKAYASRLVLPGKSWGTKRQSVEVTGIHAMHDELPEDIKLACTIFVAGVYRNAHPDPDFKGEVTSEKMGNYTVSYASAKQVGDAANAKALLSSYKRISL